MSTTATCTIARGPMLRLSRAWLLAVAMLPLPALANRGELDLAFGVDGVVRLQRQESDTLFDLKLQADGKILASGHSIQAGVRQWAVVRFNADGSLDPTFASGGVRLLPLPPPPTPPPVAPNPPSPVFLALDSAGNILVAGEGYLRRLTPQGDLDTGYGSGGSYTPPLQANERNLWFTGLERNGSGFLLSGSLDRPEAFYTPPHSSAIKLLDAGLPDTGFAADGIGTVPGIYASRLYTRAYAAVEWSGGVYVGGYERARFDFGNTSAVRRLLPDGSVDATFGNAGILSPIVGTGGIQNSHVTALKLQGSAGLLVAGNGQVSVQFNPHSTVVRIDAGGQIDAGFNAARFFGPLPTEEGAHPQLLVDADQRILMTASSADGPILVGLLPDGAVDPDFGSSGIVPVPFDGLPARALARQPDGKYLVAGPGLVNGASAMYLARYRGSATILPEVSTQPAAGSILMGTGSPGSSVTLGSVVFSNRGGDELRVTGCSVDPGFSVSAAFPLSIASGASASVVVGCTAPSVPLSTRYGTLICSVANDADEPTLTFPLVCIAGAAAPVQVPGLGRPAAALLGLGLMALAMFVLIWRRRADAAPSRWI